MILRIAFFLMLVSSSCAFAVSLNVQSFSVTSDIKKTEPSNFIESNVYNVMKTSQLGLSVWNFYSSLYRENENNSLTQNILISTRKLLSGKQIEIDCNNYLGKSSAFREVKPRIFISLHTISLKCSYDF